MKELEEKNLRELFNKLELEQPSMRFTKNVMESIDNLEVAAVSKRYVNPWIVKGVAAVLFLCLITIGLYSFSSDVANTSFGYQLPIFSEKKYTILIITINIALLLLLTERFISSKKRVNYLST